MVDSSAKSTHKKKRKLNSSEERLNLIKRQRQLDSLKKEPKEVEEAGSSAPREVPDLNPTEGRPWRNLQLILSLQNKGVDLQKLVLYYSLSF